MKSVLMGTNKGLRISAEELAFLSHTIPYEIVCGIGSRVPRLYRKKAAFPQEQRKAVRRRQTMRVRFLDTPELKDMPAVTADISSTRYGNFIRPILCVHIGGIVSRWKAAFIPLSM